MLFQEQLRELQSAVEALASRKGVAAQQVSAVQPTTSAAVVEERKLSIDEAVESTGRYRV